MKLDEKKATRKTVGSESLRLHEKDPGNHSAVDQMREQLEDYEKNVYECIQRNMNSFEGDFYIVVLSKKERLMQNVMRGYFFARSSCPTPDNDQVVYRYSKKDENLELLWVVPADNIVNMMKNNTQFVKTSEYALLNYVLKFADGSLLRLSKKINGERVGSNIIEK